VKPVNLSPTGAASSIASSAGPSQSSVIFGVVGVVLVVALGGYFAVAHVSSINDEATHLTAAKTASDSENATVVAQLAEIGQKPTTLSWESVAVAYMKEVTDKAAARTNYPRFVSDVATVLPSGAWFVSINAGNTDPATAPAATDPSAAPTGIPVTFDGYARSIQDVSAIISNINALSTMDGAQLSTIDSQLSNKGKKFRHFTVTANLLTANATSPDGTLVDNGGVDGLALEPRHVNPGNAIVVVPKAIAAPDPLGGLVRDTGRAGGAN